MKLEPYYQDDSITIYQGDSLQIIPELGEIGAVVTDPPYSSGGAFRSDRTKSTVDKYVSSGTKASYVAEFGGDSRDQRSFFAWATLWLNAAYNVAKVGSPVCCFIDWRQLPVLSDAVQAAGFTWRGVAVWDKGFGRPTPGRFSNAAEYVVWGSKGPMAERDAYPGGVFRASTPKDREHITQKPESVMNWLLQVVPEGSTVLDPFMGSGTTLKAAKELGYRAIGIETDPKFCEIASRRVAETLPFQLLEPTAEAPASLFDE
jgi:site-specific DNA-methyltransferase (adenine-specific)